MIKHLGQQPLFSTTEADLQRLILDIHDGPVQKLFVVAAHLSVLQHQIEAASLPTPSDLHKTVCQLDQLVQAALHEMRSTISALHPVEFQRKSLPTILHDLAIQHEAYTGNHVQVTVLEPIPNVELAVKIALYRVVQEALSNAFRHAHVDQHTVQLSTAGDWLTLEIRDTGRGFVPNGAATGNDETSTHLGLRGMRERLELVGGCVQIESCPGWGTSVIAKVPINTD
jgi:signal transduction histidine kinase